MTHPPGRMARLLLLLLPAEAPVIDYPFVASDVARYHDNVAMPDGDVLDDQTWDDMLLSQYSAQLAQETGIFGRQELHRRLRCGDASAASVARVRAAA